MTKPLLSIIIAAHHEGLLAHKTMLSVFRAIKKLDDLDIKYEIIITIDNGDNATVNYFERYNNSNMSIHSISFGDLATSRNYGISQSNGKYIATIDADDLVSDNWFSESLIMLEKTQVPIITHTQYSINFGTKDIIWEKFNSRSKEEDAIIMTWANRWDSAIIAPRHIFETFPYQTNKEGYGSEDWHFNSETLAANIAHKIVPHTILFVRRKDISEMTIQAADRRTVHYTKLLDIDFMKNIDVSAYRPIDHIKRKDVASTLNYTKTLAIKSARYLHKKAKTNKLYTDIYQKTFSNLKNHSKEQQRFPIWLIDEWRAVHRIDKNIFPDKQLIQDIPLYHSEMYELGITFCRLAKHLSKQPDYIMFVPRLSKGGAELVAIRYLKAIKKTHPNWHLAVVATEIGENTWINRLPKNIDFIPFGELTKHFSEQLKLQLLARLVVQSKATRLHIAQSPLMFKFAELYKSLLIPYHVYAFAFCEDTDSQGRIAGHIHSGLPYAYNSIDRIFTDNDAIIRLLQKEYGYTEERFVTHYQPVDIKIERPRERVDINTPIRLLWASRISKQKRPDILVKIAKKLVDTNIKIDIYGSFQDGYSREMFKDINSLSYMGEFNGIDSLPTDKYDAFLYTSENDGIPNILLEATAKGLAVIAPSVGGINEFITTSTGMLIENKEDIDGYIKAIQILNSDDKKRIELIKNAQHKLLTQHSISNFNKMIKRDII